MKKVLGILAVALVAVAVPAFASIPLASSSSGDARIEFGNFVGISGAFRGELRKRSGDFPARGPLGYSMKERLDSMRTGDFRCGSRDSS